MADDTEHFDDEISVADIVLKLWQKRGLIFILPLLFGILGAIVVLTMATKAKNPIIHYVSLTGIEKGAYPNGVAFSPSDLRAPEVLAALSARMGIENSDDFAEAISVSLGAPTMDGILKKYGERLSKKGLQSAEIDAINAELNEELSRATEKTATIVIDYQSLGLDEGRAKHLSVLLPTVWAEVFTTQFRVLDNTQLSGAAQMEYLSLQSSAGTLEANDHVNTMLKALETLQQDSRLAGIQAANGATPSDLRVRLNNFNNLYLSAILSRNLGNEDALTKFYQADLSLRVTQIDEQIGGIDDSILSIQSVISGEQRASVTGQGYSSERMQVTGDAISDIVNLVNKSSLSEYLTAMYTNKSVLIEERSELNLRLSKIREETEYDSNFLSKAEERLNALNEEYGQLLSAARMMNRENNATLSRALGSPHRVGSLIPKRGILIILMAAMAGGLIGAVLALVLPPKSTR